MVPRAASARSFIVALAALATTARGGDPAGGAPELQDLLHRMDGVARVFADTALRFDCKETILWDRGPFRPSGKIQFAYIFVRNGSAYEDYRSWTGLSGKLNPVEVDPVRQGVPWLLRSAFHWIQIFGERRWSRHRYAPAGRGSALGRAAFGVRFEPVPPIVAGINEWYGTAWVDPATAQILTVEAYSPDDWLREQERRSILARGAELPRDFNAKLVIERIVTEFGFEREGIRFPSRVEILRTEHTISVGRSGPVDREYHLYSSEQKYRGYRFFGIDSTAIETKPRPDAE